MNCIIDGTYDARFLSLGIWGKPTIYYPIKSALDSGVFESIIVVTENEYIRYLVKEFFENIVHIQSAFPEDGIIIDGRAANLSSKSILNVVIKIQDKKRVVAMEYISDSEESVIVDSNNNFELTLIIHRKRQKAIWLKTMIDERIDQKANVLLSRSNEKEIYLIGHSQFDQWNIKELNGIKVRNCGISGISAQEYNSLILKEKRICWDNAFKIFVLIGINDIALDKGTNEIASDILLVLKKLRNISSAPIYYIEMIPVSGRLDRDNSRVNIVNRIVREKISESISIINTDKFQDGFGNLNYKYTIDGLHLNSAGYRILREIIEQEV